MTANTENARDSRFLLGLVAGTCLGAALAMWLAPRAASEIGEKVGASARELGKRVVDQYQQARTRVDETVGDLTRKGLDVRDDVAGAVARGAHEVERNARDVAKAAQNYL